MENRYLLVSEGDIMQDGDEIYDSYGDGSWCKVKIFIGLPVIKDMVVRRPIGESNETSQMGMVVKKEDEMDI